VRYTVKPEHAEDNERLARAVFAELKQHAPPGVCYSLWRNGRDFVHLFLNLKDDNSDALTELDSFKTYTKDVGSRCENPPDVIRIPLDLLETYGLGKP